VHRTSAGIRPHFRDSGPNGGFGAWWFSNCQFPALAGDASRWPVLGAIIEKLPWMIDTWCDALYNKAVIKTFKDAQTQKIYQRQPSRKLPPDIQLVALRKLRMINNAISLTDLRVPPANRLEKLSGDRTGQCSIRINDQWRICFEWRESDAYDVEIVDYH
jgi:toxin HigB-1